MLAFVTSVLVTLIMAGAILWYRNRRPVGALLTWGEAMAAAVYVFLLLFLMYGVVPHLWLQWASSELGWGADRFVHGPGGILEPMEQGGDFPLVITYQAIADVIATLIYGVFLVGNVVLWMMWQNRGKKKEPAVPRSEFGRPLVKGGV